jgi:hypothetical protein
MLQLIAGLVGGQLLAQSRKSGVASFADRMKDWDRLPIAGSFFFSDENFIDTESDTLFTRVHPYNVGLCRAELVIPFTMPIRDTFTTDAIPDFDALFAAGKITVFPDVLVHALYAVDSTQTIAIGYMFDADLYAPFPVPVTRKTFKAVAEWESNAGDTGLIGPATVVDVAQYAATQQSMSVDGQSSSGLASWSALGLRLRLGCINSEAPTFEPYDFDEFGLWCTIFVEYNGDPYRVQLQLERVPPPAPI